MIKTEEEYKIDKLKDKKIYDIFIKICENATLPANNENDDELPKAIEFSLIECHQWLNEIEMVIESKAQYYLNQLIELKLIKQTSDKTKYILTDLEDYYSNQNDLDLIANGICVYSEVCREKKRNEDYEKSRLELAESMNRSLTAFFEEQSKGIVEKVEETEMKLNETNTSLNDIIQRFNNTKDELSKTNNDLNKTKEDLNNAKSDLNKAKEELSNAQIKNIELLGIFSGILSIMLVNGITILGLEKVNINNIVILNLSMCIGIYTLLLGLRLVVIDKKLSKRDIGFIIAFIVLVLCFYLYYKDRI